MKIKPGVIVDGLQAPMWEACAVIDRVYLEHLHKEATLTSGLDGEHKPASGRVSLHYSGNAGDFRTRGIPENLLVIIWNQIKIKLKAINPAYQFRREETHWHVEFDQAG